MSSLAAGSIATATPDPLAGISRLDRLAQNWPFVQFHWMGDGLKTRLLTLACAAVVIGLFATVYATRHRESLYASITPFVGCYSDDRNRLILLPDSHLRVNGSAAGSYKIVEPVGGKHGYLVEAEGLDLTGGRGKRITATPGDGGFLWPINDKALDITFAPDLALRLTKVPLPC